LRVVDLPVTIATAKPVNQRILLIHDNAYQNYKIEKRVFVVWCKKDHIKERK